jgi:hypothetical protein
MIELFKEFNDITSIIQNEMSCCMILDPKVHALLSEDLKGSENNMEIKMNAAVEGFLAAMPLASMNRCNMFCKAIAMHTNITGDHTMHEIFDAVNDSVLDGPIQ